ncbi:MULTISPECIES: acyl-CoA dehydrogenase family protein [Mesorhizobium]|uniref:acyl-CoA dehydrogenase family protein n=1 Tax=Mesorhizobium TaxID=68287 RepID=UPI0010A9503E|nr:MULTISPECIES: acyl-CoA dehydrogenase family protein [Mesorhizobium]
MALSARRKEIQQRAREFTERVFYPMELNLEETDNLTVGDHKHIKEQVLAYKLNAINHPEEVGGQGYNIYEQCLVNEEVGKSTGGLWNHVWQPPLCLREATEQQKQTYLVPACSGDLFIPYSISEPTAGSDAGGVRTSAVLDGDDYVINGEKFFASGCERADVALLHTIVDGDPSKPTVFIIDLKTPGFEIVSEPKFMTRGGRGHPHVRYTNVRVPADRMLGSIGQGFELTKDWFVEARTAIGARCVGVASRALALATEYAKERHQFGRPIFDFQGVEFILADMAAQTMAGKCMVYRVAEEIDSGLDRTIAHARVSAVKYFCSEMAGKVVDQALQIFGGRGYISSNPVERLYRDVRAERIWEGTSEIQKVIMGRQLRKRGPEIFSELM